MRDRRCVVVYHVTGLASADPVSLVLLLLRLLATLWRLCAVPEAVVGAAGKSESERSAGNQGDCGRVQPIRSHRCFDLISAESSDSDRLSSCRGDVLLGDLTGLAAGLAVSADKPQLPLAPAVRATGLPTLRDSGGTLRAASSVCERLCRLLRRRRRARVCIPCTPTPRAGAPTAAGARRNSAGAATTATQQLQD